MRAKTVRQPVEFDNPCPQEPIDQLRRAAQTPRETQIDLLTDCQLPQASRAGSNTVFCYLFSITYRPFCAPHFSRWLAIRNRVIMQDLKDTQCATAAINIKDVLNHKGCAESSPDSSDE